MPKEGKASPFVPAQASPSDPIKIENTNRRNVNAGEPTTAANIFHECCRRKGGRVLKGVVEKRQSVGRHSI